MATERAWLQHYSEKVPHDIEPSSLTIPQLLPAAAERYPDRNAIVLAVAAAGKLFGYSMSYARLERDVDRFAASLQKLGVQKGDRVAIFLPNCPQFVITFLAASRIGAITVPFNPLYSPRETEYQLNDCGAKVIIVLDRFAPIVQEVRARTALKYVIVTRIKEYFPPVLWTLYTLTKERKIAKVTLEKGDRWFASLLGAGKPQPVSIDTEETAVLLYTGGTTGVSKGVELSHRNLIVNAEQNRVWAGIRDGQEVALAAVPLFHGFGLTCCLNLGMLTGSTVVLVPNPTDTKGLIQTIERYKPSIFPVVPTMLVAMNHFPDIASHNLRSVKVCPCAGSPLAPAVQRTFIERTGVRPVEGYGLTEAAPVTHGNPPFGEDRHGTIGLPYPGTFARVVDFETGLLDTPFDGEWTEP